MRAENNLWGIPSALLAGLLLVLMAVLAGGAAMRESVTVDEVSHIGSGVSYIQKLDLRLNPEHPPLPKVLAIRSNLPSGSLRLLTTMLGNGWGRRGIGVQPSSASVYGSLHPAGNGLS